MDNIVAYYIHGQMGTGVFGLLGRESRISMYGVAQTRTRLIIIGEANTQIRPQAARRVCHPDFPPKLVTNNMQTM